MFDKFFPDEYVASTYVIAFEKLYEEGYRGVIFDIDNTLYSYEHSHEYGMRSLAAYCNRVFGVSEEETEECYKRATRS